MIPKDMALLVFDYGSQVKFAEKMAESFKVVYYFNTNVHDGFQDVKDLRLGEGVSNVIKVKEWATVIDRINIVAFTDCYEPALQQYFRDLGIPVFGSGYGSNLETDRVYLKDIMKSVGLPIGKYEVINGIDFLEYTLKEKTDVYIKGDHRGNFETTKWKNWKLSKGEIRRIRRDMGAFGANETYIIEDKLESIAEIGADLFVIDGAYPSTILSGVELKDTGYVGCFMSYSDMPKQLKKVTDAMSPIFRDLGYRGCHSNEVIIGKDMEGYLIDATCRMPQPPGDAMLNSISNYSDCLVNIASGIIPTVKPAYKYVCQLILKSDIAKLDDTPILVPDQYKKFVSVKNLFIDNEGTWYYSRRGLVMSEIGSVVGMGDTLKQAIEMAKEISESIEAEDASVDISCMDEGLSILKKLAKAGIKYFL